MLQAVRLGTSEPRAPRKHRCTIPVHLLVHFWMYYLGLYLLRV